MAAPDRGPRRDVVAVSGPDALTYLQSQVSQDLRDQAVGERRWTFLLEPNGRVAVLAGITRTEEDTFELDTDAGFGDALLARLDRFRIRVKATTVLRPALDSSPPDPDAERARIEAAWPRMGAEIVPGETIPAETGVTEVAVSFTKGCYPGQELVERMDSRGASAPRRLRRVDVAAGTQPGDPLLGDDGQPIGTVTSVVGTAALAYVKRSATA
jgi:folate-binding protein YgfZ